MPVATNTKDTSLHSCSSPAPTHIVSGVLTLSPWPASEGTWSLAVISLCSSGPRVSALTSLPSESYILRSEPQSVPSQEMVIWASAALPTFSTTSQAGASSPISPYPVLIDVPSGPLMDSPRVLLASTGRVDVTLTLGSSSSEIVSLR